MNKKIVLKLFFLITLFFLGQNDSIADLIKNKDDYTSAKMVRLWQQRTQGRNLAIGKIVRFFPESRYHLTSKDGTDNRDLTDGNIITKRNQDIWWNKEAVCWTVSTLPKRIIIDLEKASPLDKIVWRICAGSRKKRFTGPKKITVYGSLDGKTAYKIAERYKWREDNASENNFKLPNIGNTATGNDTYVYPLEIDLYNCLSRFIIIDFVQDDWYLASDELAVIESNSADKQIINDRLPHIKIQTDGVWISSPYDRYPLQQKTMIPAWFVQNDLRKNKKLPVTYYFKIPNTVKFTCGKHTSVIKKADHCIVSFNGKGGTTRRRRVGPVFFYCDKPLEKEQKIFYWAGSKNAPLQPMQEITLYPAQLKNIPEMKHLLVSMWMNEGQRRRWPDFIKNYKMLGFTAVPLFPRGYKLVKENAISLSEALKTKNPAKLVHMDKEIDAWRKAGLKTVYMESPIHFVNWTKRGQKARKEYRCIDENGNIIAEFDSWCLTYRGKYFKQEVDRVGLMYLLTGGADYVAWDLEILNNYIGKNCSRCQSAWKKRHKDLTWEEYADLKCYEIIKCFNDRIKEYAKKKNWPIPEIGQYNVDASWKYSKLFDYLLYRKKDQYQFQSSSLYVGDNTGAVHKKLRICRRNSGKNDNIPWLTTSTYGEVSPKSARIMLWETFCNGGVGVFYFCFSDIMPPHYFEINRALAEIAPYEDVVFYGTPAYNKISINNAHIRVSAVKYKGKILLLLVNESKTEQNAIWSHSSGKKGKCRIGAEDAVLIPISLH